MTEQLAPDEKVCPFCAETIKKAAVRCRYCHSDLPADAPAASAEPALAPAPAPVATPASAPLTAPDPPAYDEPRPRGPLLGGLPLMLALLVLCLLLGAATLGTWWRSSQRDQEVQGAISSAQARDSGLQAAASLSQKVLSYDWRSLDKDIAASEAVLAPGFRREYAKTMAGVRDQTLKNQVKLAATVVASSVVSADSHKVVALVFVNQVTTAKGTTNQRLDQNRVLVTLTRDAGEWRVSKMDAF